MKTTKLNSESKPRPPRTSHNLTPLKRDWGEKAVRSLGEFPPWTHVIQKSYVLSSIWAWLSQVEWEPHMKVPVPRFLTVRDP